MSSTSSPAAAVAPPAGLAAAREQFLSLVESFRPDLHRYAARLVGSAIDGEDIVQDTLAKAFYALSQAVEIPALRPWLFRIARNTAIDHLRRYERRHVEPLPEHELADDDLPRDPEAMRAALSAFLALPVAQRSAVILKDVLGESLEDIAAHLELSVEAVKALLVRGRRALRAAPPAEGPVASVTAEHVALTRRYVELFNRRDWPAVQAMLLEECRLDLVTKSQRKGKSVRGYFERYSQERDLVFRLGRWEGRPAIGVYREATEAGGDAAGGAGAAALVYLILLEWEGASVAFIRDFRYVAYLAGESDFAPE
jgi:RNA polymerase sigma factor (sigma-70 family)